MFQGLSINSLAYLRLTLGFSLSDKCLFGEGGAK